MGERAADPRPEGQADASREGAEDGALRVRMGTEGSAMLQVRHDGVHDQGREGEQVIVARVTGWTRCAVKMGRKDRGSLRVFFLEPGPDEAEVGVGALYVRGRFQVVRKVNNSRAAAAAWKAVSREEG